MQHRRLIRTWIVIAGVMLSIAACNRKAAAPELQTTTGDQPRQEPLTVTGCLRSGGVADDTFVLNASQSAAGETATYQLTAASGVNLREYVGQQVEVSGTLRAEQQVASSSGTVEQKPAKGTTGTPTVETKTEVDVRRLAVSSVKPTGNKCEQ